MDSVIMRPFFAHSACFAGPNLILARAHGLMSHDWDNHIVCQGIMSPWQISP